VRGPIIRRLLATRGREQQRAALDLLYLHRNNPAMQPIHDWEALSASYAEPASAADLGAILSLVERHEGPESARVAAYWWASQPQGFVVCRDARVGVVGFVAGVALEHPTQADLAADPAVAAAWAFAQRSGPLRPGEHMVYHRFLMGRDAYQTASPATNVMAMTCLLYWLAHPRLAWSFLAVRDPDHWNTAFTYLNLRRSREAEYAVGGQRYAVYTHDWRAEPVSAWLELMGERELDVDFRADAQEPARQQPPLVVLSQPEFADAVRQALRDLTRPDALAASPLRHSRLVAQHANGASAPEALRRLLRETAEGLRANPRDEKLYRAIASTYLAPAPTQERAAEQLGLPFSTYRSHLTTGVQRIVELLWQREVASDDV
jgi:hypothetical protein